MLLPGSEFWQNVISDYDLRDITLSSIVQKLLILHYVWYVAKKIEGLNPTKFSNRV